VKEDEVKILFFGTSRFAAILLNAILQAQLNVIAVVTKPDQEKPHLISPVKELCQRYAPKLPILQPIKASTQKFIAELGSFPRPDLFIVAAYGEILKQSLLDIPSQGAINIHGSLLPKYRGAAPIQRSLMNGDRETGITLIKMVLEMDAGDILATAKIPIEEEEDFGSLEKKLAELAYPLLKEVLMQLCQGSLHPISQNLRDVTTAPKITSQETKISWDLPAIQIHHLIRALSPKPGAWCWIEIMRERQRLKIYQSEPILIPENKQEPGYFLHFDPQNWVIQCGKDGLKIKKVQLEGKKILLAEEWIRGLKTPCYKVS